MRWAILLCALFLLLSTVSGHADLELDDLDLDTQQEVNSEDETDSLLEEAAGCAHHPHLHRCVSARAQAKLDRLYCFKHPHSRSIRCHRLDVLEELVFGETGTSRLARALLRRCAGQKISKKSVIKLRGVLMKRHLADHERDVAIRILRTCKLTHLQLLQLKRVLRVHQTAKDLGRLVTRTRILDSENLHVKEKDSATESKEWLERLNSLATDDEDVKQKWIKKITDAALKFDPCADTRCALGTVCRHGQCWADERCENVHCSFGYTCDKGHCVEKSCEDVDCTKSERCYRGTCLPLTSCLGISCPSGQQCFNGECIDLTVAETCKTLKCPAGTTCVENTDNDGKGARCVGPVKHEDSNPIVKKRKIHYGPAVWSAGEWSQCTKPCGQPGGYRTRTVICRYSNGKIAPDFECESASQKPPANGDCDCEAAPPAYHAEPEKISPSSDSADWKSHEWSKCSKRCEGTQTREVSCAGSNDETVDESSCSGETPQKSRPCGRPSCTVPDFKTVLRVCRGGAWVHCDCPTGYFPVSGGCDGTTWPHRWQYNNWNGDKGWLCGGHKGKKTVHVLCARGMGACRWQTSDGGDWHRQLCPQNTTVISGGCDALEKPHLLRWQMKSDNGWLCGGWNGKKRTSTLCCDTDSMRKGCKTFTRRFGDWGHITCPRGTKLISGGCDADKPFLIRASRPINRRTWQCGGWGGNKLITVTCCTDHNDY